MKIDKGKVNSICERIIEYSLYTLVFFLPASKAFVEICATLAFIAWIVKNTNNYSFKLPKTDLNIPLLFFIIISIFSVTVTTRQPDISARTFFRKSMEYVIIFFMMAEVITTKKRLTNILIAILASSLIVGLDGIYQHIMKFDFVRRFPLYAGKVTATFQFSNNLAGYLITVLPIPISLVIHKVTNRRIRFSLVALSALLVVCLLLSRSRGAWLGFILALFFVCLFNGKKVFLVAILFLIILALFSPLAIRDQIRSFATLDTDVSTNDRMIIWETGWRMFIDKPLFGHGLGTFMSVFGKYKPKDYIEIVYAHNCYLQMAAEIGIFGLLIFLWFIVALIKSSIFKLLRFDDKFLKATLIGIVGGILAYLVHSFVDTHLYSLPLAVLFWAMAGLAAAKTGAK
ncbi:MAG: hypothetical protein AMJ78_08870 [Omnitrophica WOR_2 bacterium SM23_29]|nr:MAG: hypothetical protein AMJ78_08870 [Omnitrophica WOR_2 bacterium SM23_29]